MFCFFLSFFFVFLISSFRDPTWDRAACLCGGLPEAFKDQWHNLISFHLTQPGTDTKLDHVKSNKTKITKQNKKNRKSLNTLYLVDMERWHRMLSTLVTPAAYTAESKDAHAILSDGRIVITINTYTAESKDAHATLSDGRIVISDNTTIITYRAESITLY